MQMSSTKDNLNLVSQLLPGLLFLKISQPQVKTQKGKLWGKLFALGRGRQGDCGFKGKAGQSQVGMKEQKCAQAMLARPPRMMGHRGDCSGQILPHSCLCWPKKHANQWRNYMSWFEPNWQNILGSKISTALENNSFAASFVHPRWRKIGESKVAIGLQDS